MHIPAIWALTTALLLGGAAHAEDALDRIKTEGVLKVGTEDDFAPFDYVAVGQHVGFNVDLFAEIGADLSLRIEFVTLAWDGVLPGLETGRFDVVAGPVTITRARLARFDFTPPVAEATVALLGRRNDSSIQTPTDIAGKAVGAGRATAQLQELQVFAKTLANGVQIMEFAGYDDAYAALAAGRVAAVVNAWPNLAFEAKKQPDAFRVVTPPFGDKSYFAYLGRKGADSVSLMRAIDAALIKIKRDGRLAKLQIKWFGLTFDLPDQAPEPKL